MARTILYLKAPPELTPALHLLRPYTGWKGVREYTTKAAIRHIHVMPPGYEVFGTHTTRYPVRAGAMAGGSVYWCKRGITLFRMPLHAIEPSTFGWWILMEPKVIPVHPLTVGMVRGWRYLEHDRRPADNEGLREQLLLEIKMEAGE